MQTREIECDRELSILMPCLNEAETLGRCIAKARGFLARTGIDGEIIVADNGSNDGSQSVAFALGARLVSVPQRGYGNALLGGIRAAQGEFVIMGDSDDSYDFSALDLFVDKLRDGFDLVTGNRFLGGIQPGAMPALHRYFGNPVLTAIGRLLFRSPCRDFHCGLRGFRRDSILRLDLQSSGMEFATEMIVKATTAKLRITEVPTTLDRDGRGRPSHLRSWRDGWRHLRFLLLFSPRWLFLYPGLALFFTGLFAMFWLLPGPRNIGRITLDIHTLLYASLAVTIGFQSILFWIFARFCGMRAGIVPRDAWFERMTRVLTFEFGLIAGAVLVIFGLALAIVALSSWKLVGFGPLSPGDTMRLVIPSATAITLAFQIASGALFINILALESSCHIASDTQSAGNTTQVTS